MSTRTKKRPTQRASPARRKPVARRQPTPKAHEVRSWRAALKNVGARRPAFWSRQERSGDVVFSVVALVVVFGSLLGIVVVQTFIVQNRVKLDAVNADLSVERERNQQLRLNVIELEAPKRILDTATTRLGMVRPEERTYLPGVDPNLVTIRQPAAGDPFGPGPLPDSLLPQPEPVAPVVTAAPADETADADVVSDGDKGAEEAAQP